MSTDPLQTRRQPLVTATGITLGFLLNFSANWVRSDSTVGERLAWAIGILIVVGEGCLVAVLIRALRADVAEDDAETYYRAVVRLFTIGVLCGASGVALDMATAFWDG